MTTIPFAKPPTTQQAVLAELRRFIAQGKLRPGQQLAQDALAIELNVSRVPIREALKILEGEGQVTHHAHRGYFVTELSIDDMLEVYRIRALLEEEALRVAMPKLTRGDLDRFRQANEDVESASRGLDLAAMTAANRKFHFILIEACAMPRLIRIIRILWDATEVYRAVYYGDESNRQLVMREHDRAIAAVAAQNTDLLVRILAEHRDHSVEALTFALKPG